MGFNMRLLPYSATSSFQESISNRTGHYTEECNLDTESYNRRVSVLSSAIVTGTDASTTCTACFVGSLLIWTLVFATMIVDIFFIFNVMVRYNLCGAKST